MDTIKLVIWDLDETFWAGTLSEGGIQYCPRNHDLVVELTRRGIVNSVCSKNDLAAARAVLEGQNIWTYFVFPKIDWLPKGEMIARTLEEMGLRAPNVLFVDDNPQNLEEARFYNAGIQVATPDVLATLLDQPEARGKDDRELSRLKQYQLLEKKVGDRQQFSSSNEDFLRQCQIQVEVRDDCHVVFDRLLEMIQRTNQLNFTKRPLDATQLRGLIDDPAYRCAYVKVRDRYGDYGIAGFYALTNHRLEQFLFSCRILNMGVERWIYDTLGRPVLDVAGDVSDDPKKLPVPDWIQPLSATGPLEDTTEAADRLPRILLKGGCDLEQVIDFLGRHGAIEGEFNFVTNTGAVARGDHSEVLRRCELDLPARYADVFAKVPFLDSKMYDSQFFSGRHDVYVFSALMDMTQGLYRYRDTDWLVPYGDLDVDITDPAHWELAIDRNESLSREFLTWFREHFRFEGRLSEATFRDNLHWLCGRISPAHQLILINGAEIVLPHAYERDRHDLHARMNAVLAEVAADYGHVDVCDVRKFASTPADVTNNIRHYRRGVYHKMAGEIRELIVERWSLASNPAANMLHDALAFVSGFGRDALWRAVKRLRRTRTNPPAALRKLR
jgi:FkbH-like protein